MNTNYPIIVCIPNDFEGVEVNTANQGLYALERVLIAALRTQGYEAEMAHGGLDNTVVLNIQRLTSP